MKEIIEVTYFRDNLEFHNKSRNIPLNTQGRKLRS